MTLRNYSNSVPPIVLQTSVNTTIGTLVVASTAGFPTPPFTLAIDRSTPSEEFCLCTAMDATTFTVTRGYDGSTGKSHTGGTATIEHSVGAIDYREANAHMEIGSHYSETYTYVSAPGSSYTIDFRTNINWDLLLTANLTLAFSNPPPSGQLGSLFICIRNGGTAYSVTWPSSVKWAGGTAPTLSGTNKQDVIGLFTFDGGVTYAGVLNSNFSGLGHG